MNEETTMPDNRTILKAIEDLDKSLNQRIDNLEKDIAERFKSADIQFEAVRQGIAQNSASFDRMEATALEAKSIALITRSQLTILTEEIRQTNRSLV